MSFESMPSAKKPVDKTMEESHEKAKQYLGSAYDEGKVDAIAAAKGWDVVLTELAALPKDAEPETWYTEKENAECLEMFGKNAPRKNPTHEV